MLGEFVHRNPAETVELGARVVRALVEERDSIMATKHYNTCDKRFWDWDDSGEGCQFCYYGPVEEFRISTRPNRYEQEVEKRLGAPWFF